MTTEVLDDENRGDERPARYWWPVASIATVTAIVYATLLRAPSIMWDDDLNIFQNPFYQNGQWTTLWTRPYFGMYIPITSTVWAALYSMGGGQAWPFRLLNIVLHVVNVVLFARLLIGLLRRFELESAAAIAIGTAIFALHPEQTAAVSWISGARDLASTMFAFCAIGVYFGENRRRDIWATLLFVAALMCKPGVAGIPLAIAAFVWLFDRDRLRETAIVMSIWAVLVLGVVAMTSQAQSNMISVTVPFVQRPVVALDALGFYVMKTLWPFGLAADYGRRPDVVWSNPGMIAPTILLLAAAIALIWWAVRRNRAYLLAVVWPLILAPVLGIVTFPYQRVSTVADHYNYIPLAVVGALIAIAVADSRWRLSRVAWGVATVLVAVGGVASWSRSRDWHDNDRFLTDMLAKNPASFSARIDYSALLCDRGEAERGLSIIETGVKSDSTNADFLANDAYCLLRAGRIGDVIRLQARVLDPALLANLEVHQGAGAILANALAGAYIGANQPLKAFAYFCQANALTPDDQSVARNLDRARDALRAQGREVRCAGLLPWNQLVQIVNKALQ